jgi:hypothetical protein
MKILVPYLILKSAMRVNLPGLPMVMEPKTTGMAVLGEPMFANVLLRLDSVRAEEILAILNVGNSWS